MVFLSSYSNKAQLWERNLKWEWWGLEADGVFVRPPNAKTNNDWIKNQFNAVLAPKFRRVKYWSCWVCCYSDITYVKWRNKSKSDLFMMYFLIPCVQLSYWAVYNMSNWIYLSEMVWNWSWVGFCHGCSSSYDVYDPLCVANSQQQFDLI